MKGAISAIIIIATTDVNVATIAAIDAFRDHQDQEDHKVVQVHKGIQGQEVAKDQKGHKEFWV